MKGIPLEKNHEVENRLDEILSQERDPRGLKIKYDDEYHIKAREIQRRSYWRRKLLKERESSKMDEGSTSVE